MFAFFGLGAQELIIIGGVAVVGIAVVGAIVFIVSRAPSQRDRINALEHENRRLEEELDRRNDRSS
jgi:hypothetical protein